MPMSFKAKLKDPNRRLTGHICTIPSAIVPQAMAAAGADYLIIDQEHGAFDVATLHAMIAATQGSECAPLVRIAEIGDAHVKRALDLGAEGICFPLSRSADDVRRCVSMMRYAPEGTRSWGPFIAHSRWNETLLGFAASPAARDTVCMVLIETAGALEAIEDICAVEGVDILVVAPFDLSTELGVSGQIQHPRMQAAVARIEAAAAKAGVPLGGVAMSKEQADSLRQRGYRATGGFDVLWLKGAAAQARDWFAA